MTTRFLDDATRIEMDIPRRGSRTTTWPGSKIPDLHMMHRPRVLCIVSTLYSPTREEILLQHFHASSSNGRSWHS